MTQINLVRNFVNSGKSGGLEEAFDDGRKTDVPNVRARVIEKYLLFYEVDEKTIYVLTLRHQRRDADSVYGP